MRYQLVFHASPLLEFSISLDSSLGLKACLRPLCEAKPCLQPLVVMEKVDPYVGIDVSKDQLDVALALPNGK
jgi:hypothetical protein